MFRDKASKNVSTKHGRSFWVDTIKAETAEIQCIDKSIDGMNWIVFADVIIEPQDQLPHVKLPHDHAVQLKRTGHVGATSRQIYNALPEGSISGV